MAFSSFIPLNLSYFLSSPSPSTLVAAPSFLLQPRFHIHSRFHSTGLEASLSYHTASPPYEENPESKPPSNTAEQAIKKKKKKKKKKKRKLRPNFYDQALDRWSIKISSQRSRFPWQEQQQSEEAAAAIPSTGISMDSSLRNRPVSPPWTRGAKPRNTHLGSGAEARNPVKNVEFVGEGVKSRLDVIVEKLNGSLDHPHPHLNYESPSITSDDNHRFDSKETAFRSSFDEDEGSTFTKPAGLHLGRRLVAPWDHGAKPRETSLGSKVEIEVTQKGIKFDGEEGESGAGFVDVKLDGSSDQNCSKSTLHTLEKITDRARPSSTGKHTTSSVINTLGNPLENGVIESMTTHSRSKDETQIPLQSLEANAGSQKSRVCLIVEQLQSSLDQDIRDADADISFGKYGDGHVSDSDRDIAKLMGSVSLPWEREGGTGDGERFHKRTNTELAEKTIPELELRRLRNVSLRMKERMKVGPAGVSEAVVERIHEKWKEAEVVKIKFEDPPSLNMKRIHEILEMKTGGLVIWRSGSSVVLYRGMNYELLCVQSYSKLADTGSSCNNVILSNDSKLDIVGDRMHDLVRVSKRTDYDLTIPSDPFDVPTDTSDIDSLLDQLGPRFKDWSGRNPLPVDADLHPGVIPGYKPPFRLLPYKTRSCLTNMKMTSLRRLARTMPPHFALGRNRQHQGLADAIVKLWEKSDIAKIAIKRGVPNTCNERMAEEIKKLTGGILISRNKEYIVFYRGNDFLKPSIRDILVEKEMLTTVKQDEEEAARLRASTLMVSNARTKGPLVAGTLAETVEANTRWANQPSTEDREKMMRDLALAKHTSLVRYFERKLAFAKIKVRKAERALAKVQEFLQPAELPTDLETVTDEERFLFRKIGLKMRAFLLIGRREVFDGTIQNMHLHWKHRELVKLIVKRKNFAQVKHIAISLEAESGGVLISLDKTTKGYAIIMYRGKNYQRPPILRPKNLLTRRQALARSIELQRREALNHHISSLRNRIQMLKSQLDQMEADRQSGNRDLNLQIDDALLSDDDVEDEGEEAYLQTYRSGDEDDGDDGSSKEEF